jgi:hypothetical protein
MNTPNLSTVLTSTQSLVKLNPTIQIAGSPWYNPYLLDRLKPFEDSDVKLLMDEMLSKWLSEPEINEKIQTIRELADGHPALLQNLLHLLYNTLRSGNNQDVEAFKNNCLDRTEGILSKLWDNSTKEERKYLICLALSNPAVRQARQYQESWRAINRNLSQKEGTRHLLEQRGIIKRTTTQGQTVVSFSFNSSLMERWVRQNIQDSQDSEEIRDLENVLFGVTRGDLKQLGEYIDLIFTNKFISLMQLLLGVKKP